MKRTRLFWPRSTRGLTLIELVVAIVILSLGALAAVRAGDQSARQLSQATPRLLASIVAENRAEELRSFGFDATLPGTVEMGGQRFDISVTRKTTASGVIEATITARAAAGPGAVLLAWVPATAGTFP